MALSDHAVIDCHAHIGSFRGYDLREETLLDNLDRHGIALALVSNIDGASLDDRAANHSEEEANRIAAEAVRRHADRLRGLLWVRPPDGDVAVLEPFLGERLAGGRWTPRLFVGLKLHPEMNGFAADAPEVDPYLRLGAAHRLPVVVHCDGALDAAAPGRIYSLARRHPEVDVVLYHMGFGGPHGPSIDVAERARERGDARLYLETAQADPDAVVEAVERAGADRVLFGSDATYYGAHHYEEYGKMIDRMERALAPTELAAVLYGNSRRLFRLEDGDGSGGETGA